MLDDSDKVNLMDIESPTYAERNKKNNW